MLSPDLFLEDLLSSVEDCLKATLRRLPASVREICEDQLGGKLLRPRLCLLCAHAVGGDPADAVRVSAAVELIHTFSLIHDDVMDGDIVRRGHPSAWTRFGVARAVLAGDALLTLALASVSGQAQAELLLAMQAMIRGQASDLDFERRRAVSLPEYRRMAAGKTGALFAVSCRLGAVTGGAGEPAVRSLGRFGLHLGMAFQGFDDIHNLWPTDPGAPSGTDLVRHKQSLPVVVALGSGNLARAENYTEKDIDLAGGRRLALTEARGRLLKAWRQLDGLRLTGPALAELAELTRRVGGDAPGRPVE